MNKGNNIEIKKAFKYGLILSSISLILALLLGITYFITKPFIDKQELEEVIKYLNEVDASLNWEKDKQEYDFIEDLYLGKKDDNIIIYSFKTRTIGYNSGNIDSLIFISDNKIKKIKIINMTNQTSGIGTKISEEEYLDTFIGKDVTIYANKEISYFKSEVISGATISSNALINAIINSCTAYLEINDTNDSILNEINKHYPDYSWEESENKEKASQVFISTDIKAYVCEENYLLYGDYYANLKILVFIKNDYIDKIVILNNSQTSEYGIKINDINYLNTYKGRSVDDYANKNIEDFSVEIITSSTITSQAFVRLVIYACSDYVNLGA